MAHQIDKLTAAACILAILWAAPGSAAETYTLEEPAAETRFFGVGALVEVTGKLQTGVGDGKALSLDLKTTAKYAWTERRMPETGRDADGLRALRYYEQAGSDIEVQQQKTRADLRPSIRFIVVQGRTAGVELYSPTAPLTYQELELLRTPGDPLATLALLPQKPVAVGDKWSPGSWVIQMLTGLEAVANSDLSCELVSVENRNATIRFQGSIEGAVVGAATNVTLSGRLVYSLQDRCLTSAQVTQTEKRSVGAVSPGLDVTATINWQRRPAKGPGVLTDEAVARIPVDPPPQLLLLRFDSPWGTAFHHDRNWHLFHQNQQVAVLRLLDKGTLVAQCNVSPLPSVAAGQHAPEAEFQEDIRRSLGPKLKSIEQAEQLKTSDGRFLYRVTAIGEVNQQPMHWFYYLCAGPSGRQTAFVFAVESALLERLGNRDVAVVNSLQFNPPRP